MRSTAKRLDSIEESLTPKQAVILWMEQAHQYPSMYQYVMSLEGGPETAYPMYMLPNQVEKSVQTMMKGKPRLEVSRAIRSAVKDTVFLFHLHQQVNTKVLSEERAYALQALLLVTELKGFIYERHMKDKTRLASLRVSIGLSYPLDTETADAVEAAMTNYVEQWELAVEDIEEWVYESLGDEEITDDELETRCAVVRNAIQELIDAGEVEEGKAVYLETVLHPFLRDAPLVEGEWIDRHVVELAESGARLKAKGFVLHESEDDHPLAWERFIHEGEGEQESEETTEVEAKVREQVRRHLSKFPGQTREIGGRSYLNFRDYCHWRGRRVKGKLDACVSRGMVIASWNEWIEAHGSEGVAMLGDIKVSRMNCYAVGSPYQVCRDADELAQRLRERVMLLDGLRMNQSDSPKEKERQVERVMQWKAMAESFLGELYSARHAIGVIGERYFDDCEVLFPDASEQLSNTIGTMEGMVEMFNDGPAWELEHHEGIVTVEGSQADDGEAEELEWPGYQVRLEELKAISKEATTSLTAYLLDMAKAEALDFVGDNQAAVELVARYIGHTL